jgi:ABC-2 type transport system ATP-binding protein
MQHTSSEFLQQAAQASQRLSQAAPPAASPIIAVEHLIKRYKREEVSAVDDISFMVEAGSLFTLLGPNGAGKTTTISILTTMLTPTAGQVWIAGYDVVKQAREVRKSIGIIFQKPSLDLNLSAHSTAFIPFAHRTA